MAELDIRSAQDQARKMAVYVQSYNGQKWGGVDESVDRQNLAVALDNLLETAAMLGNVADRLALSSPRSADILEAATKSGLGLHLHGVNPVEAEKLLSNFLAAATPATPNAVVKADAQTLAKQCGASVRWRMGTKENPASPCEFKFTPEQLEAFAAALAQPAPSDVTDEMVERFWENLPSAYEIDTQDEKSARDCLRSIFQPAPVQAGAQQAVAHLPFAIMSDELAALHRFYETTEDGQDYDVPVPMMKRLAIIGLVRLVTGNRYEFTDFGLSVRNGDFADTAPLAAPTQAGAGDAKGGA